MRTRFTSIIPRAAMMLLVMLLTSVSAWADDSGNCGEEGDNVTYSYEESTHTLTISGTGAMGIEYPAPWYDYAENIETVVINDGVTTIVDYAFSECSALTSVTIPASVTTIGVEAFSECSALTSVTIPASVTAIGAYAFSECSALTSVTIPASVTAIGVYAFEGCGNLTSVTISASVTTIETGAFFLCSSLTAITIPAGVTQIGSYAFGSCSKLESVTFEDGSQLEDIGASAFWGTALTSFEIGSSVTSIGEGAFGNCEKLTTFNVKTGNECFKVEDYVLFSKDGKTLHTYPMGRENDSYTIPDGVTTICGYAFCCCSYLEDITIPPTVTSIGEKAFDGTAWIANQPYEDGLLYVNNIVMGWNDDISSTVAIKDGTTMISPRCFSGYSELTSVTIPASVTTIGESAFDACTSLATVTFETGSQLKTIGAYAFFGNCMTSITIPASVTTIETGAFEACTSLATVTFETGSQLTAIGTNAFLGNGLTSVTIPATVTSIGDCVFYECANLAAVTLNSNPVMGTDIFPYDATVTMNLKPNGSGTDYWMPFYNQYYGFKADANTTVYKGAVKGNHVLLTAVDDIPYDNAVVLKSTASSITLTLSYDTTADDDFDDNEFWGTDDDTDASEMASAYCLSQGKSGVGFYKYAGIIPANSTYFVIDNGDDSQPDFFPFKIAGLKGDANGDGDVTITDAVTIVDYILGNEPEDFVFEAADVNEDGEVNITDAVGVVDIILNSK